MSLTIRALSRMKRLGAATLATQVGVLRAQYHGSARLRSVLSCLSLLLSAGVGYLVFDDMPRAGFALGAAIIVAAALWATLDPRSLRARLRAQPSIRATSRATAGPSASTIASTPRALG